MKALCPVLLFFACTLITRADAMDIANTAITKDTTGPILLPVRWLHFTAAQNEKSVILKWSTLHEQGIKRFTIERSTRGNDFRELGYMTANGNSSTYLEYQYEDLKPIPGNCYYRVTCEDENGFQTISLIRKINYNKGKPAVPFELRNVYVSGKTIHLTPVFHIFRPGFISSTALATWH